LLKDIGQGSARLGADVVSERFRAIEKLHLFFGSFVSIFIHWWFPWFIMFATVEPSGSAAGKPPQNFNNSRDAAQTAAKRGSRATIVAAPTRVICTTTATTIITHEYPNP
jgi:hypothetical protein